MSKIKWGTSVFAYVVTAMLVAGCGTTTNTNTNANGNTTVVNQNVNANTNANANTNTRATNANVTREEYEKNKVSIMEEAKRLGRKIGIGAEDGWLWTKTRAALATADDLRDSTINVDVDNAIVTLSGTVANQVQKNKAEQIAKGIDGVKGVRNQLTVSATGNTNGSGNTNKNTNTRH